MSTNLSSPAPRFSPPPADEEFDDGLLGAAPGPRRPARLVSTGGRPGFDTPQHRHGTVVQRTWYEIAFNPRRWSAGHWALLGVLITVLADVFVFFYASNLFGIDRKFEIEMWLLTAGIAGFLTIALALWGIIFNSARGAAIFALILGFPFGAPPAWLVGNTLVQLMANGGTLPVAPPLW